jgi:ATP-dependent DNA helicase RecG
MMNGGEADPICLPFIIHTSSFIVSRYNSFVDDDYLQRAIETVDGVAAQRAKEFRRLGVATVGDLLDYFPRDYQYEAEERTIDQLVPGQLQTTRGEVVAVDYVVGRVARFEATLDDGTGKLALTWFNSAFLRRQIHPGDRLQVQGAIKIFRNLPQMAQAKWQKIDGDEAFISDSGFRAIYPASGKLSSETISDIIGNTLHAALPHVHEWFDPALLGLRGLIDRRSAYQSIHQPKTLTDAQNARKRLVYDELMLMQLALGIGKKLREGRLTAPVLRIDKTLDGRIRKRFPFSLTDAQQNSIWEIVRDLQSGRPMNRLLQGDVGSGKTVVAVYAMLMAVANRLQSAMLAPTEVLAEQHYLTLTNLLKDSNVKVDLFTSRTRRQSQGKILDGLSKGSVNIAVGTQALLQKDLEFANLGLVVVDEQHKLGVQQRAVLKGKGLAPHYLVMTATPIPRTLALSYFADFDVSSINQLPPGRQPIQTRRITSSQAGSAYKFIRAQITAGRQAYVVLPKIDDDGTDESKSVIREFEHLSTGPLSGVRLAMLHGQMSTEKKQAVMLAFRNRETDVLVATTVIEVGIDVPNATVMLIGDAERFGLSQLHQLRGRVGRGSEISHCILLSDATSETALARLNAMVETNDGFEIAEMDLQLRGPGEFFGTRQHGLPEFKLADLSREMELLQLAKEDALEILQADPKLTDPRHQHLRTALRLQVGDSFSLAQIG